jgi:hypothetical protein
MRIQPSARVSFAAGAENETVADIQLTQRTQRTQRILKQSFFASVADFA